MADFSTYTSKLEPFLLMSKSAKGAAAVKLIENCTSSPGVFVFAQLLDVPNIKELSGSPQHGSAYALLDLFAHGTYQDYTARSSTLPALNTAQITKLKYLSLASYASQSRILPYAQLLSQLGMESIRELEDLIIDAIYQDIVRGKLDQKHQQFEVEFTMGRDLQSGELQTLLNSLQAWSERTTNVLSVLDQKIDSVISEEQAGKLALEEHERQQDALLTELQNKAKKNREKDGPDDVMDVDEIGSGGINAILGGLGKRTKAPSGGNIMSGMLRKRSRA